MSAYTYTCPLGCGPSHPLSCPDEAEHLLQVHLAGQHGNLHRFDPRPATPTPVAATGTPRTRRGSSSAGGAS